METNFSMNCTIKSVTFEIKDGMFLFELMLQEEGSKRVYAGEYTARNFPDTLKNSYCLVDFGENLGWTEIFDDRKNLICVQFYKIIQIHQLNDANERLVKPKSFKPPLSDAYVRLKDMNRRQVKLALNRECLETTGRLPELKSRLKIFYHDSPWISDCPGYQINMRNEYLLRNDLYVDRPTRLKEFTKKDLLALAEFFRLRHFGASYNKRKLMSNISRELLAIFPGASVDLNGMIILEEKMFH